MTNESPYNGPSQKIYTGYLALFEARFRAGRSGSARDHTLGEAMLARLREAHDGTRDGVAVDMPWDEWDGYCSVVNDRTGG